jgi:hypothetical protein
LRLRVQTHNQYLRVAAIQTAAKKLTAFRSYRFAILRKFLQAAEHPLDGVSVAVEEGREAVLPLAIGLGWNVWHGAAIFNLPLNSVAVVSFVAVENFARRKPREKFRAGRAIGNVSTREHEGDWPALCVGQRMNFGRSTAARATWGEVSVPSEGYPPLNLIEDAA